MMTTTHLMLFVDANAFSSDRLLQRQSSLFEWNHFQAALTKFLNNFVVMAQVISKVLHFSQELFTFVQRKTTLAVGAIQQLILSARGNLT
jgi:hypothetical protein